MADQGRPDRYAVLPRSELLPLLTDLHHAEVRHPLNSPFSAVEYEQGGRGDWAVVVAVQGRVHPPGRPSWPTVTGGGAWVARRCGRWSTRADAEAAVLAAVRTTWPEWAEAEEKKRVRDAKLAREREAHEVAAADRFEAARAALEKISGTPVSFERKPGYEPTLRWQGGAASIALWTDGRIHVRLFYGATPSWWGADDRMWTLPE